MGILNRSDKEKALAEIARVNETHGPAPLTNVDLASLTPEKVDVIAVGALVLTDSGSTVLVRREETPDEWLIPGGTLDPDESILDATVRETYEETGSRTAIESVLRIGYAADYGPPAFREVNLARFGKESINLLFVNFLSRSISGELDGSADPSSNILEVRAFPSVPFDAITHVYKVLFVHLGLVDRNISDYPAVEFNTRR